MLRGARRLHLGCGPHVLPEWSNLDIAPGNGGIVWDVTRGLPVQDASIDYVYSEHFIEHLSLAQGEALLVEIYRVLRPGGVVRLTTPDLRTLIREYQSGRLDYWREVDWVPATPARLLNESMRLWGHKFVYDHDELVTLLRSCGFTTVEDAPYRESRIEELAGLERRVFRDEIIIEASR